MRINTNEDGNLVISEVYNSAFLKTNEGNQIAFCFRDDTIEFCILPKGSGSGSWWRIDMQDECVLFMEKTVAPIVDGAHAVGAPND